MLLLFPLGAFALSLEEKVGQLLMVYFNGQELNDDCASLITEVNVGGFILYNWSNSLDDPYAVWKLCAGLQEVALNHRGLPLFIATDQEGGSVVRLRQGFTEFPGNRALGQLEDPSLAYRAARVMGLEMGAVGINMNLAPVVDVADAEGVSPMTDRSFGSDPDLVTTFSASWMEGLASSGTIPCLKHFLGYGSVLADAHEALPIVTLSRAEIERSALYPFRKLCQQAPLIMSAHVLLTELDPGHCVTLSSSILQSLLRKGLGYQGVIITDSLTMQGVLEECGSVEEAAIRALEAGNDILLIGDRRLLEQDGEGDVTMVKRVYQSLLHAVQTGRVSEERVDESVARVMQLKNSIVLPNASGPLWDRLQTDDHRALSEKTSSCAAERSHSNGDVSS